MNAETRAADRRTRRPLRLGPDTLADRRAMTVITLIILSTTFLQRLVVPLGPLLSITVPVVLLGLAFLAYHGDVVENPAAVRWFVLALAACTLAAGLRLMTDGSGSVTSLLYLPIIWVAFTVRLHPDRHHLYERVLARFDGTMLVLAVVGILQTVSQAVGAWTYRDYVLDVVPESMLFSGYNTSYPIQYGSPIIKANGFVFVEPSIYAQFLALAVLCALVRRASAVRVAVLLVALGCTISGTGLLFLAFGVVLLALRRGGWWTARLAIAGVVAAVGVLLSPFGGIFLTRATETSGGAGTNTSGSLRFIQPYQQVLDIWNGDPSVLLIGKGAGYADALATNILESTGLPINFSGIAKLVLEYGLPAALLFTVFVAWAWVRLSPSPTIGLSAVFASALLTGSLLQPHVLYMFLPVCSLFAGYRFEQDRARATTTLVREPVTAAPVTIQPARPNPLAPEKR